jgi:hypothetical protein
VSDLAILTPVLNRPHRVQPLLDSIHATVPAARVIFLTDPGDDAEAAAIRKAETPLQVKTIACGGNYAQKIRKGVEETDEPYLFLGADDLHYRTGWYRCAKKALRGNVQVVGVNDMLPRKRSHATHFLMTRAYAETPTIDGKPGPLFDGYAHWNCDDELIATAMSRGVYAYAPQSRVRHLHPMGKSAPDDNTYRKGRARRREDASLFRRRSRLWTSP